MTGLVYRPKEAFLGKDDDLSAIDETGTKADFEGEATAELGVFFEQSVGCERDGGSGGVSGGLDSTLALLVTVKAFDLLGIDQFRSQPGQLCLDVIAFAPLGLHYLHR